jgi:hypothetical protein
LGEGQLYIFKGGICLFVLKWSVGIAQVPLAQQIWDPAFNLQYWKKKVFEEDHEVKARRPAWAT